MSALTRERSGARGQRETGPGLYPKGAEQLYLPSIRANKEVLDFS